MLSDVDSFNCNFLSLKVSFISYINLWAKFQNNRLSYFHPLESSTFQGSVFWTLALSYLSGRHQADFALMQVKVILNPIMQRCKVGTVRDNGLTTHTR